MMRGVCKNMSRCVLAAAGSVQEVDPGAFVCRECRQPLTAETPAAAAAAAPAAVARPPAAAGSPVRAVNAPSPQAAPKVADPPAPAQPRAVAPQRPQTAAPARVNNTGALQSAAPARVNNTGTVPRPTAAAPASLQTTGSVRAPAAASAQAAPAATAQARRAPTTGAARPAVVTAMRSAEPQAERPDAEDSEARYRSRFPVGASLGVILFALMTGFAYWVVHDWRIAAAPPPPRPVPVATQAAPQAVPLAAPVRPVAVAGAGQALLRLTGSDAMVARLGPALAEAFLASLGATAIQDSSPSAGEHEVQGTRDGARQVIAIARQDSPFEGLLGGAADMVLAARSVRPDEARKLSALGSMTSPANEHVVALDGIAVIVSRANPVSELRREQLAQIFGGRATDWSAFGGTPGPIHVYVPNDGDTLATFQPRVLGSARLTDRAKRLAGNDAVTDAVVADVGGVGLVALPWIRGAKALAIADDGAEAVIPNAFTLTGEEYLLARRLYLYTSQAPQNPNVSRFVDFALSPQGQALVRKAGFVELTLRAEPRSPPARAPAGYVKLTAGAKRLAILHFRGSSSQLDSRATSDLDRVVDYLRDKDLGGASVKLVGFADGAGGAAASRASARGRAAQVAKALAQRGVSGATVEEFGASLPVASNASEDGRERNRRVEVWVAR